MGAFSPPFLPTTNTMSSTSIISVALLIFIIAVIGGWLLQKNHRDLESTGVRILVFGLYFWALVFAQGVVGGLISFLVR